MRKWLARKLGRLTTKTDILKMNGLTNTCSLLCLLCVETVTLIKSGNIKRHYESKHRSFEEKYPQKSEVRVWKISELRAQYERSTRVFTHSFTGQQHANECSLKIAWILGQHKKTFSDTTVVKECLNAAAETLLEGKQRD